jgi:hypothetical protein
MLRKGISHRERAVREHGRPRADDEVREEFLPARGVRHLRESNRAGEPARAGAHECHHRSSSLYLSLFRRLHFALYVCVLSNYHNFLSARAIRGPASCRQRQVKFEVITELLVLQKEIET